MPETNSYGRIFNFSAGPSTLPVEVLEEAQRDLLNYKGSGMSVMEMSHRGAAFEGIIHQAEADLRSLLSIPEDYSVLFLQGGASLHFSMTAMNFLPQGKTAGYIVTGAWGEKALASAQLEGEAKAIYSEKESGFRSAPDWTQVGSGNGLAYIHSTSNETIQGVAFQTDPPALGAPMICDMSSDILSRPVNVGSYDLIYAGAQKNMGPAGLVVVIAKKSFIATANSGLGPMLDYKVQDKNESLYNTPPCWSIYVTGLVYKHLLSSGGVRSTHTHNVAKAKVLYDAIETSNGFYKGHAKADSRSLMNVTFTLPSDELTTEFLKAASEAKLSGLKGHRSVGGCRASIYNAFPIAGCERLAQLMAEFKKAH